MVVLGFKLKILGCLLHCSLCRPKCHDALTKHSLRQPSRNQMPWIYDIIGIETYSNRLTQTFEHVGNKVHGRRTGTQTSKAYRQPWTLKIIKRVQNSSTKLL